MCVDLASELKLLLSRLNTIVKNRAALSRRNHCDTHRWRIWSLIFLQDCYQSTSLHYYAYFVTSIPPPPIFVVFSLKCMMIPDVGIQLSWCHLSDHTVTKLWGSCFQSVCVPCCIYIIKLFKSLHFKWLAKVLCYVATHFFRVHNFHFPDFTPFLLVPTKM